MMTTSLLIDTIGYNIAYGGVGVEVRKKNKQFVLPPLILVVEFFFEFFFLEFNQFGRCCEGSEHLRLHYVNTQRIRNKSKREEKFYGKKKRD